MKTRLSAAAIAAAIALSLAPAVPAHAQVPPLSSGSSLPQLPDPRQLIDDAAHQAQATAHRFLPQFVPPPAATNQQQALLDATNRYRARHGLKPLRPLPPLSALAQGWASTMSRDGYLRQQPGYQNTFPAGWKMAAQNVAQVKARDNADAIVAFWATSPGHRANMLRPDATHLGVGVATSLDGRKFAVQNIARY